MNTLTIASLKETYKSGEKKPQHIIEEIIQRAEKVSEKNIWIISPSLDWIQPYLDRLETLDPEEAPLWGIPFAIKDNIDLAGIPTTAGCPEYAYTPETSATVVQRLLDAGAVPVGKTNLDQFATGLVGTRSPYGETHNARKPELISGGSSSGSAVAVACSLAAFALGTDTAGSGRVPAALNGIAGLKPSLGAWPVKGVVPACASLDCVTVFAHELEETRQVDQAVRGLDKDDPWSKEIPFPADQGPSKVYIPKEEPAFFGPYAENYQEAWEKTKDALARSGLKVEKLDTTAFSEAAELLYGGPLVAERWAELGEFVESNPGKTFPVTEEVLRSGKADEYDAASVYQAQHQIQEYKRKANILLEDSVLLMPTAGGTWTREEMRERPVERNSQMGHFTNHCNLLDLSAVAVPGEEAAENLPFGITLFANSGAEGLLYETARRISQKTSSPVREETEKLKTIELAVCGLHMRGYPLEKQMQQAQAEFLREDQTSPDYKFIKLHSEPEKPGLIRKADGTGASIHLEVWKVPVAALGSLVKKIPAPLGIGKVKLNNGKEISGFVCEGYAEEEAEDITPLGSWHKVNNAVAK
jgi:allophanate hydrolase